MLNGWTSVIFFCGNIFVFFLIHLFFKIFFWDVKYVFSNKNLVIFVKSFFFPNSFYYFV